MTGKHFCGSLYVPACKVTDTPLIFFTQQVAYSDGSNLQYTNPKRSSHWEGAGKYFHQ